MWIELVFGLRIGHLSPLGFFWAKDSHIGIDRLNQCRTSALLVNNGRCAAVESSAYRSDRTSFAIGCTDHTPMTYFGPQTTQKIVFSYQNNVKWVLCSWFNIECSSHLMADHRPMPGAWCMQCRPTRVRFPVRTDAGSGRPTRATPGVRWTLVAVSAGVKMTCQAAQQCEATAR